MCGTTLRLAIGSLVTGAAYAATRDSVQALRHGGMWACRRDARAVLGTPLHVAATRRITDTRRGAPLPRPPLRRARVGDR